MSKYDALLLVSFGGPEGPDDVMPFLQNVTRGKSVPPERLEKVAEHYELFDGVSPLNSQNRALLASLAAELNAQGPNLPVYWGNRNWHPLLVDAVSQMAEDGVRSALAFVTSAFGSYSGCRQYLEDIEDARRQVGPNAPEIKKLRLFYNHPGFIEPLAERISDAVGQLSPENQSTARLLFTAHSIPVAAAEHCPYERQLRESCRLAVERLATVHGDGPNFLTENTGLSPSSGTAWELVFQSRSGPPAQPWLGPDILDRLQELHAAGRLKSVIIVPLGFLAENMEVVYDLDIEALGLCERLGIDAVRAAVVGSHPRLVRMIRELVVEQFDPHWPRLALGPDGPAPDICPVDCCLTAYTNSIEK